MKNFCASLLLLAFCAATLIGGCVKPLVGLSSHTIKFGGDSRDVVWVVRDRETIYRCAMYNRSPVCVKVPLKER